MAAPKYLSAASALALAIVSASSACAQSNMPAPTTPLSGTEIAPCIQSGGYKSCTTLDTAQTLLPRTNTFSAYQVIDVGSLGVVNPRNGVALQLTGNDGGGENNLIDAFGFNGESQLTVERYDYSGSFQAVGNAESIGGLYGAAFNGTGDPVNGGVQFTTTEDQTPTHNGTDVEFYYTPNASTALTKGMAISPGGAGGVVVGAATGGDKGPGSVNATAVYVNGTAVGTGGAPGGTSGQLQYNNGGTFGGFSLGGDCSFLQPNITCTKTNGTSFGTAAIVNTGTSGPTIPLLNGNSTWSGTNTFGGQTYVEVPYDGTTSGPSYLTVMGHTGALNSGVVSPRSAAFMQILGIPQYSAGNDEEINLLNVIGYGGYTGINIERYDRGTIPTSGSTSTSSAVLHFANSPYWATSGATVYDNTTSQSIGTVASNGGTTLTLMANAAHPVGSGDILNIVGTNNGAVQNGEGIGCACFDPYDGQSDANTAGMGATATETHDYNTNQHGTDLVFTYTPNNPTHDGTYNKRYYGITISHGGLGGVTIGDLSYQVAPTDLGKGTLNVASDIQTGNHYLSGTTTAGGTCSGVTGNDVHGYAAGNGSATCTVAFQNAYAATPTCLVNGSASASVFVSAVTTTDFTVSVGGAGWSQNFQYICIS